LFAQPSSSLTKRIDSKFYGSDKLFMQKAAQAVWMQASDVSSSQSGISGTLTSVMSGISIQSAQFPSVESIASSATFNIQASFQSPTPYYALWGTSAEGMAFVSWGLRFQTQSPDFILGNLMLGWTPITALYG
jgi:hypothetical protein